MLKWEELQRRPREFLAMTGHTPAEFLALLSAFEAAYERCHPLHLTTRDTPRQRGKGAGYKGQLSRPCDRLLFILVYLKTNPLQTAHALAFGMGQSGANFWIQRLLPIVQDALSAAGHTPQRPPAETTEPAETTSPLWNEGGANLLLDGTERRRPRPQEAARQKAHYSGKKKTHTDKNLLVVNENSGKVAYLSRSVAGHQHDKKMADAALIPFPRAATLGKDTGFQGYEPDGVLTFQPQKNREDVP